METSFKRAFWKVMLLLAGMLAPMAIGATESPEAANASTADTNAPAEPVCRKEVYTGSRIPMQVCADSEAPVQTMRMSEQLLHPNDLVFILSTRFTSLTVHSGATSGVSVHQ